ncbi:MAG: hypothetical protein AB2L24_17420 [Mangrovibacterium sp.]
MGFFRVRREISNGSVKPVKIGGTHFISDSRWDERGVIDQAALQVSHSLPIRKLTGLIIDETRVVKKGEKSVGGWVTWLTPCPNAPSGNPLPNVPSSPTMK